MTRCSCKHLGRYRLRVHRFSRHFLFMSNSQCKHLLFSISTSITCFFHSSKVGISSLLGTEGSVSLDVGTSPAWTTQTWISHTHIATATSTNLLISLYLNKQTNSMLCINLLLLNKVQWSVEPLLSSSSQWLPVHFPRPQSSDQSQRHNLPNPPCRGCLWPWQKTPTKIKVFSLYNLFLFIFLHSYLGVWVDAI